MTDEAIKEFLANGGVIQQIKPGVSGIPEGGSFTPWGAPRKAGRPPASEVPPTSIDESLEDDRDSEST
jgi:hypothetical protein